MQEGPPLQPSGHRGGFFYSGGCSLSLRGLKPQNIQYYDVAIIKIMCIIDYRHTKNDPDTIKTGYENEVGKT